MRGVGIRKASASECHRPRFWWRAARDVKRARPPNEIDDCEPRAPPIHPRCATRYSRRRESESVARRSAISRRCKREPRTTAYSRESRFLLATASGYSTAAGASIIEWRNPPSVACLWEKDEESVTRLQHVPAELRIIRRPTDGGKGSPLRGAQESKHGFVSSRACSCSRDRLADTLGHLGTRRRCRAADSLGSRRGSRLRSGD
jgi:hypothetical protein